MDAPSRHWAALMALALLQCATAGRAIRGIAPAPANGSLQDLHGIMQRTEEAMLAVIPCDNADTYFSGAILPHRVGAVELCNWLSEHGSDTVLLNISSAVYNSPTENQIYEIKAQLPDCPLTPAPAPAKSLPAHSRAASMISLSPAVAIRSSIPMKEAAPLTGNPDHDWAIAMVAHHQASIAMARVEMQHGTNQPLKARASELIVTQTLQVMQMRQVLSSQYATVI
ncbi:hypothetical protein CVIRNUC_008306 [Coccomyxa viridis]|uniref:DUF305 domain-containing protein n=1 Tax=Coccomyxa viridis TaxID=1274662 RepID=A0AAV1IFS5_9CHLO|nr:hypothetical protein CVIRNUC_008306 [Coccomyxa viridis]